MMYILGGGVGLVLALIGILNFINVMCTGVMVRKMEFAMMESVGMTKKQMRRMLILEGLDYAIITAFLVATLGSAVTLGIFRLFQKQADYAVFTFPFLPMVTAMLIVFLVCIITQEMAYRAFRRTGIAERLCEAQ